jgi:hypothetical protein
VQRATHYLSLTTRSTIILALRSLVELTLALLDHLGIQRLLELFEDLRVCVSMRVQLRALSITLHRLQSMAQPL